MPGPRAVLTTALVSGYSPFQDRYITKRVSFLGIRNGSNEPARRKRYGVSLGHIHHRVLRRFSAARWASLASARLTGGAS